MNRIKRSLLRFIKFPPQMIYAIGLGPIYGRMVLLLTTTGRKSGLKRVTPLQYEEVDGAYLVAAARGTKADWFRNIIADPNVDVQTNIGQFHAHAEPITDPAKIADFLEIRLQRHPVMLGAMFKAQGFPPKPKRTQLEQYAQKRAMVLLRPDRN